VDDCVQVFVEGFDLFYRVFCEFFCCYFFGVDEFGLCGGIEMWIYSL